MGHVSRPTAASGAGDDVLARARAGDHDAFTALVEPLRRELHAHCYRMLGSAHDADDAVQDTLVRAWRGIAGYTGAGTVRSWLYTVATRVCVDAANSRGRRALPMDLGPANLRAVVGGAPSFDVPWLGPYHAELAEGLATPDARYERREAVELAFVAALQYLPGNQRAALLLFEVLGFSVAEISAMMETSVASVNSALQRARRVVTDKVPTLSQQRTLRGLGDAGLREIVTRYSAALESGDADSLVALLTSDVTWSMPPQPHWYRGRAAVTDFLVRLPLTTCGRWRHVSTVANGQAAVACYLWSDDVAAYAPWSIDVLTLRGDRIADVVSFLGAEHFGRFDLPASLEEPTSRTRTL